PYLQVNGGVYAQVSDGSGGWYIGGHFSSVRGILRNNLAHIDASGNVLAWNPNAVLNLPASVKALALSGSTVYAGGNFEQINGVTRDGLAAIDAATGALLSWNPSTSTGTDVDALLIAGNTLFVGGSFSALGGFTRTNLASFDLTTTDLTGWNPGSSSNSEVDC